MLFPRSEQLHRTHHNLVRLVPNLEILAHIPNISRYKGFELYGQVFPRLSQFGGVTGLYFLFLAIGDDFLYKALRNLIACQELTKSLYWLFSSWRWASMNFRLWLMTILLAVSKRCILVYLVVSSGTK